MAKKLTSRKFWISVAAFAGSIAASIAGMQSDNEIVAAVGVVCAMLSAAIYAAAEAYVDANTDSTEEYSRTDEDRDDDADVEDE